MVENHRGGKVIKGPGSEPLSQWIGSWKFGLWCTIWLEVYSWESSSIKSSFKILKLKQVEI